MSIWAIVPIKPLHRAKSRLATVLETQEREVFSRNMLDHTLKVLKQVKGIADVLVISRDTAALSQARDLGVKTVQETGAPELLASLTRATQVVGGWNATGVLIVAADIPFLTPEDIETMVTFARKANNPNVVVLAPDLREDGTNAMLVKPPGLFEYRYGPGSFEKHTIAAKAADAELHIYRSPTIALDIDIPTDLERYMDMSEHGTPGAADWQVHSVENTEAPKG